MTDGERPWRSALYIPGSNARALDKARGLPVDAIIFDLEDAVAPAEKVAARDTLAAALRQGGYGDRALIVRINGFDTEWGEGDFDAVSEMGPPAILLPKVGAAETVAVFADRLARRPSTAGTRIWAMIETTRGLFNAAAIAVAPRMQGFVLGTNDLAAELGCEPGPDRMALSMALQTTLAAARMGGIVCLDGVHNAIDDPEGLRTECAQGRALGMDGKTLIHPAQIAVANEIFAPSAAEIDLAHRRIAAWEAALAQGKGVAVVDGRIVENLHVASARRTIARARAAKETG
ncbi:CoA ester lyase [Palleronia sediminis]|uniref:CoA ester lyase n=1 Tax=Palleronia sediminis TaxID=2547833 RepID=A0A4R6AFE0_9RHOB|nr:CoA ester lyase [Palleronia sediminis]TDL81905.1 CoA ester lyase [Palleronia sediminis]